MGRMSEHLQVMTAASSRAEADRIADALVEQRMAACVQIVGPVASTYRWQGRVERADEWLCIVKTMRDRFDDVSAAIRQLHSYECPEVTATPITAGSKTYLEWLATEAHASET